MYHERILIFKSSNCFKTLPHSTNQQAKKSGSAEGEVHSPALPLTRLTAQTNLELILLFTGIKGIKTGILF